MESKTDRLKRLNDKANKIVETYAHRIGHVLVWTPKEKKIEYDNLLDQIGELMEGAEE